jgi:hypothetical protein
MRASQIAVPVMLVKRCESDGTEAEDEAKEHQGEELARGSRGSGEFMPDEDAPGGGDHGGALSDGVGDSGSDIGVRLRCDEVGNRAAAPYKAAEDAGDVPAHVGAPIVGSVDGRLAIERFFHEQQVGGNCGEQYSDGKEECHGVGVGTGRCECPGEDDSNKNRTGYERVEASHEKAGDQTENDAAG